MRLTRVSVILSTALLALQVQAAGYAVSGTVQLIARDQQLHQDHANTVVFIEAPDGQAAAPSAAPASASVSQKSRQFAPQVLPVLRGTRVDFPNDDSIYHNIFSLSRTQPFDLGSYPRGESRQVTFERPGLVTLYCNIHPNMVANVLVLNNGWFAKTDADGRFRIEGVPAGDYQLRLWHPLASERQLPLQVGSGDQALGTLTLAIDKRTVQHKNKYGKPYSGKY